MRLAAITSFLPRVILGIRLLIIEFLKEIWETMRQKMKVKMKMK